MGVQGAGGTVSSRWAKQTALNEFCIHVSFVLFFTVGTNISMWEYDFEYGIYMPNQTVHTRIRQLLEQSDWDLHCLSF